MEIRLLISEQNLCEIALVKNAARNGKVCYHHDSKKITVLLCFLLPRTPTLYWLQLKRVCKEVISVDDFTIITTRGYDGQ